MTTDSQIPPLKKEGIKRPRRRPNDELLREVIQSRAGIVAAVAQALGVAPRTVRGWRERSPRVRQMFDEAVSDTIDLAESRLLQGIKKGNVACIIFYLKCKAGWRERSEVEVTVPKAQEIQEGIEQAKRIIASAEGAGLINNLLAIAAGREPGVPLQ